MAGVSNQTVEHDAKTRGIILHIVEQIKSQGVFDRFRRDCLEELDGKEPYRQLKQRVESHVATFLSKQTFSANLPKNQLRTSLRANINQSEVLSKGVDRLLEQVLVEKSNGFYKEIENLVEEHLISTGHYTRYDKSQRSDAQPRSELTKLSDKEVEDIIKQETDRLLEASTDEKSKESNRSSMADTPPPGTSGEVIEVETLISIANDESSVETLQHLGTNVQAVNLPETDELKSAVSSDKTSVDKPESEDSSLKEKTQENQQNDELKSSNILNAEEIPQTGTNKGQEMAAQVRKTEISISASSNETDQMSAPEIVTESDQVKSSVSVDDNPSQPMDVDTEPLSSDSNTYELPGQMCENKLKTQTSEESAVKICQSAEKHEVPKGDTTVKLDLQAFAPQSKLEEGKGDKNEVDVTVKSTQNPTAEIKIGKISEAKVDNQEVLKAKVEHDVAKSGEMKLETVKPEKAGVAKPKVDKRGSAEVDKPEVVKPELNKPEVSKSKVKLQEEAKADKPQSKLSSKTVTKAAAPKPVSTLNIFSTDEEADEDLVIPAAKIAANQQEKRNPEFIAGDIAELSDSDITVSSVHTSDLSSLEDSDMEYEDYQELVLKKSKGKQSGTTTSDKSSESVRGENDEAGADIKNDSKAKSGESNADTKGNVDMVSERFDTEEKESDATGAAEQSNETKSGAAISKGIDGESGEVFSSEERNADQPGEDICKNNGKEVTESDASTSKVKGEKNLDYASTTALNFAHESTAVSLQTTEPNGSEAAGNTSFAHTEKEHPSPKDEKPTCLQETTLQISEAALFRPIDPDEPNILETASSQDSETAYVQPTGDASDDNETTMEDSDVPNIKFGRRRHSHRISTEQESESSNDATTPTEEQKEALSQRRSARVASKEKTKPDEKDERSQANIHKAEDAGDSARQLRRTRYSQDKTDELKAPKSKEERRNERAEKRVSRAGSDSTDSDVKPSKRSKRTVRPTRCYSPSENS